jgi:hypothetical protein
LEDLERPSGSIIFEAGRKKQEKPARGAMLDVELDRSIPVETREE